MEAFEDGVVEFFQRNGVDTVVPDDLGDELHDIQPINLLLRIGSLRLFCTQVALFFTASAATPLQNGR